MSEWYEELDYDENPFTIEGQTYGFENLINELDYAVHAGNMLLVEGEEGTGKTKLLREMIKKYGGFRKIAYVDCKKLEQDPNIELLLKKRNGVIGRLFNIKPKNMIVLLDDIDQLSEKNCERIKYFYDQNFIRSVIFSSKTNMGLKCSDSVRQRISKTVKMKPLSDYEAVQLVREKVGDLLSDHLIKEVYTLSNRNLKTFLNNCEKVSAVALKQKQISTEELRKIMGN
ncbi:MAG: AAA family ATPase [archaeon]